MILSMRRQVSLMRERWPEFELLDQTDWSVSWKGGLLPLHREYIVEIVYRFGFFGSDLFRICPHFPRVRVLSPLLENRPEDPGEPIPHHYPDPTDAEHPTLCLFDPRKKEWGPEDSIADTTLPWTIEWLGFYEGWRATGKWEGGGSH